MHPPSSSTVRRSFHSNQSQSKKWVVALNGVISLLLMAAVLYWVGAADVLQMISSVDWGLLLVSVLLLLGMYAGMIARIGILLAEMGQRPGWWKIIRSHWAGMLLADFTPARAGYFAAAGMLRRFGVPSEKALLSIFGPQIFDFALKLAAGTLAVYYLLVHFLQPENGGILYLGSFGMTLIIATMLLAMFSGRFLRLFGWAARLPLIGAGYRLVLRMQAHAHVVVRKTPHIVVLLLFTWTMKSFSWYLVARSLGITVDIGPYPEVLFYYFFQPLITMLEFMPSPTLAGIGLSEGGSALVMAFFGVSPAAAAAFALVARFKTTLVNLLGVPDAVSLLQEIDIGKLMKNETEAGVEST